MGKQYGLPPRSVSLIIDGEVQFNSATFNVTTHPLAQEPVQPSVVAWYYFGDTPGIWDAKKAISIALPPEQISITQDKTDFLWYAQPVTLTQPNTTLTAEVDDMALVFVDGVMAGKGQFRGRFSVQLNAKPGEHALQILSITMGLVSFGIHQEEDARGLKGSVLLDKENITKGNWTAQPGLVGEFKQIYTLEGFNDVTWQFGYAAGADKPLSWFSVFIYVPEQTSPGPYTLDLLGMGKGYAYFNGNNLGRYWLIRSNLTGPGCGYCNYKVAYTRSSCYLGCGDYTQRFYHVPQDFILFGQKNLLVIFEETGGDPSSVKLIQLGPTTTCGYGTEIDRFAASAFVRCPSGTYVRKVDFASFGSVPAGECGQFQLPSCNSANATAIAEKECLGRTYCQLPVSTAWFGDPCPAVAKKSLYIQVSCS